MSIQYVHIHILSEYLYETIMNRPRCGFLPIAWVISLVGWELEGSEIVALDFMVYAAP